MVKDKIVEIFILKFKIMQDKNFSRPGYEYLTAYQLGKVIQDLTVEFCNRFIDKKSRTHDQMVQAARSNSQNIAEGLQQNH
ncbi:MAG: hypothetical protein UR51_C0012G0006 [Candidatus Moranbacteria bacterium GW2011_GWF1_34_10]|nr:MAG: hypothetical protein UR51_C0012G0006 [Candidatus Moranbacteria bacterium GW2011_GWF1_34_10]